MQGANLKGPKDLYTLMDTTPQLLEGRVPLEEKLIPPSTLPYALTAKGTLLVLGVGVLGPGYRSQY